MSIWNSTTPPPEGHRQKPSGWLGYAKLQFVIWLLPAAVYFWIETHQDYPKEWLLDFLNTISWAGSGALLTIGLCFLYECIRLAERSRYWIGLVVIPVAIISAFFWFAIFSSLNRVIGFTGEYVSVLEMPLKELFHNTFPRVVMLALWHLVGLVRVQSGLTRAERERSHRLEKLSLEAQIRQLRGSLNPHFLFNSLNSAIALVDENPETAKEMMLSLSMLLHETLTSSGRDRATLKAEIDLVRKYVEIERIRYEEDLQYNENISNVPDGLTIPPFLLLPLVENAIKHGMRTSELPLRIAVSVEFDDHELRLGVENTGKLGSANAGSHGFEDTHLGVKSITDRLAVELPGRATFSLEEKNGQVVALVIIQTDEELGDGSN